MHIDTNHQQRFICAGKEANRRLDVVLADRFPDISRARIQRAIAQRHVTVNAKPAAQKRLLAEGDCVSMHLPSSPGETAPEPENIPLAIVYEDDALLVIDKPPGLVVHPAPGHDGGTLVNALLYRYGNMEDVGEGNRPGIVHRLDKDTSGVMVIARNQSAYIQLTRQFRQHTVFKEYLALVHGRPIPSEATIQAALTRHPRDRQKFAVTQQGGRAARTDYRLIESLNNVSLLKVNIATGRTHQIRVHLAWRGHPVLGDQRYGKRARKHKPTAPRQMLHAFKLRFNHPVNDKIIEVTAQMPLDMQAVLDAARTDCASGISSG